MLAYFDQQREQLDPAASLMDNVTGGSGDTVTIDGRPRHVSGYLRDFLFPPERLRAPVSMLSGGERNRLMLAQAIRQAQQSLGDGRAHQRSGRGDAGSSRGDGCAITPARLLLVSHDRAFLDNVVTSTLVFEGEGRIGEYVGGYSDSLRQRAERSAQPPGPRTPKPGARSAKPRDGAGAPKPPQAVLQRAA